MSGRLRREVQVPRPRLERLLVAWALANVMLVVTMCGGLFAIRATAADRAPTAHQQMAQKRAEGARARAAIERVERQGDIDLTTADLSNAFVCYPDGTIPRGVMPVDVAPVLTRD